MKLRSLLFCGAASTAAAFAAGAAIAQTAPAAPSSGAQGSQVIVVTATRRQESVQRVSEAITAFSQHQLTAQAISNSFDLNKAVPGLQVNADSGNGTRADFSIRGRGLNYGAAAGSVETYFADVPLSPPFQMPGFAPQFFDLQSLQVLKGPQGTLFGRSTTGGAILFVPQAPTDQFGGYLRLQGGTYNDFQAEGAINLPLGDIAALRLSGFDWQRDGYGHTLNGVAGGSAIAGPVRDLAGAIVPAQSYDNEDVQQFRASLLLHPTSNFSNTTVFAFDADNNRNTPKVTIVNPASALGGGVLFLYPNILNLGPHTADIDTLLSHATNTAWSLINTTQYNFTPNLLLKNIFGYIDAHGYSNQPDDTDGSPINAVDLLTPPRQDNNYQATDEVQLQGRDFDDRLTWIVGGIIDYTFEPAGNNINIYNDTAEGGPVDVTWEQNTDHDYGVFGSLTYKFTDQFSVTAGERHSWDNISLHTEEALAPDAGAYFANTGGTPAGAVGAGWSILPTTHLYSHFQGDTYNVTFNDQIDSKTLIYAGYRRGYKPGGFNTKSPAGGLEASFNPETVDDFNAGVKRDFVLGDMPGRIDLEAYWDLYHNEQVSYLTNTAPTGVNLATVTLNVPATTYRGIDLAFALAPTKWMDVNLGYAYIDAFNTQWPDPTCPGASFPGTVCQHLNLAQNPVAFAPHNKVTATVRLHADLPNNEGELVLAPTVTYTDQWFFTSLAKLLPQGETSFLGVPVLFNPSSFGSNVIPAYTLVDLRGEWNHIMGSRIDGAINVTNLTNQVYKVGDTAILAFGVDAYSFGPPQMVSVELSTRF